MRRGHQRLLILSTVAGTAVIVVLGCQPRSNDSAETTFRVPPTTLTQDHHPPPRTPED